MTSLLSSASFSYYRAFALDASTPGAFVMEHLGLATVTLEARGNVVSSSDRTSVALDCHLLFPSLVVFPLQPSWPPEIVIIIFSSVSYSRIRLLEQGPHSVFYTGSVSVFWMNR